MLQSSKLLLSAAVLLWSSTASAASIPVSDVLGKFGFDWLKPEKAKCVAMTDKSLPGVTSCTYNKEGDTGSFSGKADYYVCKVGKNSELMVYKTQARCKEELETMQSNAP